MSTTNLFDFTIQHIFPSETYTAYSGDINSWLTANGTSFNSEISGNKTLAFSSLETVNALNLLKSFGISLFSTDFSLVHQGTTGHQAYNAFVAAQMAVIQNATLTVGQKGVAFMNFQNFLAEAHANGTIAVSKEAAIQALGIDESSYTAEAHQALLAQQFSHYNQQFGANAEYSDLLTSTSGLFTQTATDAITATYATIDQTVTDPLTSVNAQETLLAAVQALGAVEQLSNVDIIAPGAESLLLGDSSSSAYMETLNATAKIDQLNQALAHLNSYFLAANDYANHGVDGYVSEKVTHMTNAMLALGIDQDIVIASRV